MPEPRSIFVSGGSNGIGAAIAERFRAQGWRVGIGDIAEPDRPRDGIAYYRLDVTDRKQWQAALDDFAGSGPLDVLVNNAGIVEYGRFEDIGPERSQAIVDVNLMGTVNGVAIALPFLRRSAGATIVNIASMGAYSGGPKLAVYCATKFAVKGLSEALDGELAADGIAVRCIMPHFTETAMVHKPGVQMNSSIARDMGGPRVHTADKVAEVVYSAVENGRGLHYPVGFEGKMVAFLSRMAPAFIRRQARKHTMAGDA